MLRVIRLVAVLVMLCSCKACGTDNPEPPPHCDDIGMPHEDKSSCNQGGLCTWESHACCKKVRWHQDVIDPKCEGVL